MTEYNHGKVYDIQKYNESFSTLYANLTTFFHNASTHIIEHPNFNIMQPKPCAFSTTHYHNVEISVSSFYQYILTLFNTQVCLPPLQVMKNA